MSRNTFMAIAAILALLFGLAFILVPAWTMTSYAITLDEAGQWMTRYLGSAFLGIGVLTWLAKGDEGSESLSAIMLGAFVLSITGLVVSFLDAASGHGNSLHWLNVVIYLFLTVGWGYFRFVSPD